VWCVCVCVVCVCVCVCVTRPIRFFKIYLFVISMQRGGQEHFTSLKRQLCVIYAKMKIAKIYAFQNLVNERTILQHPLRLTFTLLYIYNLCSRFICFSTLLSTCNYIVINNYFIYIYNYIINFKSNKIT